jgi:hypothetical protein
MVKSKNGEMIEHGDRVVIVDEEPDKEYIM